jgi:hypothetical protein
MIAWITTHETITPNIDTTCHHDEYSDDIQQAESHTYTSDTLNDSEPCVSIAIPCARHQ